MQPGIENDPIDTIGKFGDIALNGGSTEFEAYSQMEKKWFHFSAYRPSKGYFVLTSNDITDRKRAEIERETSIEFLHLVNEIHDTKEMIHRATAFFQEHRDARP